MRIVRTLLGATAVLAAATACSSSVPEPSPSPNIAAIEQQLEWARTRGAAPEQVEVLEQALAQGEVKIEQIVDLNTWVEDCLTTAGFQVRDTGMEDTLTGSGILMPGYVAYQPPGMDDAAAGKVMDECGRRYMEFAQSAYMGQPTVLDQYYGAFDTPEIRQCLIDHGYDVDDDATVQEINTLIGVDMEDHSSIPDYELCLPALD